jgi:Zn-dependent peptidase ImmA (M78 family)
MERYSIETAEHLASKYRTIWNLSLNESISLHSFLLKMNVITLFRPLSESAYGVSIKTLSNDKFILINSNNITGRQNFTIAHELYHLFVEENPKPHICLNDEVKNNSEKNADLFASCFLMPRSSIITFLSNEELKMKKVSLNSVFKMQQYFNVSFLALIIRLKQLKLITESQFNELNLIPQKRNVSSKYGYNTTLYEKGNEGLIIGDYLDKANQLFENDLISEGHYFSLINLVKNESN